MFRRATIVVCVLSLVLSLVGAAAATTYTFTTLNPVGSETQCSATGLALVGGVPTAAGYGGAGGGSQNLGPGSLISVAPATWNAAGTGTSVLGEIPGSPINGYGWGIDGAGDVVGSEHTTGPNAVHAFFLQAGGTTATVLPTLNSGDAWVAAFGVQNSSTVVGMDGSTFRGSGGQGVVWTNTGGTWGVQALPTLPGGSFNGTGNGQSPATAINSAGIITGWCNDSNGNQNAVTWTNNGSAWTVNDLVNRNLPQNAAGWAESLAANSYGLAVGVSQLGTGPSFSDYACLFSGGSAVLLGNFGGASGPAGMATDAATAINDSGVIVGYSDIKSTGQPDAFIWTPTVLNGTTITGTIQDMNTVFASIIPSGWTLSQATGIDNNGDICGYMTSNSNSSVTEGFLITASVPEPSSWALLASGLLGSLACTWRKRQ